MAGSPPRVECPRPLLATALRATDRPCSPPDGPLMAASLRRLALDAARLPRHLNPRRRQRVGSSASRDRLMASRGRVRRAELPPMVLVRNCWKGAFVKEADSGECSGFGELQPRPIRVPVHPCTRHDDTLSGFPVPAKGKPHDGTARTRSVCSTSSTTVFSPPISEDGAARRCVVRCRSGAGDVLSGYESPARSFLLDVVICSRDQPFGPLLGREAHLHEPGERYNLQSGTHGF